mgnify:CR=1 FL=1
MFRQRVISDCIKQTSASFPVVMLTGARQTGKTTLLRHIEPHRTFVSLDDPDMRRLAKEDPAQFIERFPPPVFIDEFQYAPQILPHIKMAVDTKTTRLRKAAGMYWLSGSQKFALMKGVQESLAGRVAILNLAGFSLGETAGAAQGFPKEPFLEVFNPRFTANRTLNDLFKIILKGDKPELWSGKKLPAGLFYSSYIQTYLERYVRGQLGIRDLGTFDKFMRLLAGRMGQLLNMAGISSEIGVSIPTVKEWLTVLERSDQIMLLQPYFGNINKRLIKTPKVYFLDTGLAAHLVKWADPRTTLAGPMAGQLFENWVISEIVKSCRFRGIEPDIYFWRTKEGEEFDLAYEKGSKLHLAEIKLSSSVERILPGYVKAAKKLGNKLGSFRLICASKNNYRYPDAEVVSAWSIR